MKRSRLGKEQIIGILREQGSGVAPAEVCRKHGASQPTFHGGKATFGGMRLSDGKRLRPWEAGNTRQKKMLAEAMLDNAALKDIALRK